MIVTGKCFCGKVIYEAEIDPERIAICHCSDCQEHSGTAFGVVASVTDNKFRLRSGELKSFIKVAASGNRRELTFCPDCGTRIYAKNADDSSGFFGLRYGTIKQRHELTPKIQVWCESAQSWAIFDDIPRREGRP